MPSVPDDAISGRDRVTEPDLGGPTICKAWQDLLVRSLAGLPQLNVTQSVEFTAAGLTDLAPVRLTFALAVACSWAMGTASNILAVAFWFGQFDLEV